MSKFRSFVLLLVLALSLVACGPGSGQLEIRANGEDFVREGFVSKDGWSINFDSLLVTIRNVEAYQTDPPYTAENGDDPEGESVSIAGPVTIDLAEGDASADPILVETLEATVGQYNAIGWEMVNGDDGYTIRMIGTAEQAGQTIDFDIQVATEYRYVCGEYIGDVRKGFVDPDMADDVEMTFHFDHVFGDIDAPADDHINTGAVGFTPLAELAEDGVLNIDDATLSTELSAADYELFTEALGTLGHVGEGHCFEAAYGYTDKEE